MCDVCMKCQEMTGSLFLLLVLNTKYVPSGNSWFFEQQGLFIACEAFIVLTVFLLKHTLCRCAWGMVKSHLIRKWGWCGKTWYVILWLKWEGRMSYLIKKVLETVWLINPVTDIFYNTEELTHARSIKFYHSVVEIDFFI